MQIVTLTTDSGLQDFYVAAMKGAVLKNIPSATIIDVSHSVKPFDVAEAAFQLNCCYKDFPDGTIHIIGVDSEPNFNSNVPSLPTIMYYKKQYFISNDNGFYGAFLDDDVPEAMYRFSAVKSFPEMSTFTAKNCFIELAAKIIAKTPIESFAETVFSYKKAFSQKPIIEQFLIQGTVIHIDSFGNIITNVSRADFDRFGEGTPFVIYYLNKNYHIDQISTYYNDVSSGERLAIFNSNNLLEIAINRGANGSTGGAAKLFGVRIGEIIRIEFTPAGSRPDIHSLF